MGRARRQGGVPARGAGRARRRQPGRVHASDAFCVDRHRDEFLELVEHDVDILFANEAEISSLYEVDDFDDALQQVAPTARSPRSPAARRAR